MRILIRLQVNTSLTLEASWALCQAAHILKHLEFMIKLRFSWWPLRSRCYYLSILQMKKSRLWTLKKLSCCHMAKPRGPEPEVVHLCGPSMCIGLWGFPLLPPWEMLSFLGQMLNCLQRKGSRTWSSTCHLHGNSIKIMFSSSGSLPSEPHEDNCVQSVEKPGCLYGQRRSNLASCSFPIPQTHSNICTEKAPHLSLVHAEPQSKILIEGFERIKEAQRGEKRNHWFYSAILI